MEGNKNNNRREKIRCELCGVEYNKWNKSHHLNTDKHKNNEMKEELKRLKHLEKNDKEKLKEEISNEFRKTTEMAINKIIKNEIIKKERKK